jgi:NAD(P)-dependent dehydrogenase (short-subunit alcohol dehydrogenase family)
MVQHDGTALVTGVSRGIGRATALALAETGAHVLVHYGRSAQEAESLVSEIQTKGGSANAISADLGTPNGAATYNLDATGREEFRITLGRRLVPLSSSSSAAQINSFPNPRRRYFQSVSSSSI